jgi:hypothetical protein
MRKCRASGCKRPTNTFYKICGDYIVYYCKKCNKGTLDSTSGDYWKVENDYKRADYEDFYDFYD